MSSAEPTYLGDGLYASYDGYQFWLIADDPESTKRVALEPVVFDAFLEYVGKTVGVTITVAKS